MAKDKKGTILIVDDEKGVLNLCSLILRDAGYETLVAESGYAAHSLLEKRVQGMGELKVDLIISDWVMQGWDGPRLMTEVRARPYGIVPFILMSGAVTREQLESAAKAKTDAVLLKPIQKDTLLAKVNEVLERWRKAQGR